MKIFLVSNLYPSQKFPNFGTFVGEFARGIEESGATISCKAVIDRKSSRVLTKLWLYFMLYTKVLMYGLFCNYDIIYVHYIAHTALPVYLVSILRRKKIVLNVHGDDIIPRTRLVHVLQTVIKSLLKRTSLVVIPSVFFKKIFLEKFKFPENKLFISPSGGIDLNVFYPIVNAREKLLLDKKDFIVGYVSRISEGKGWDIFVDAISEIRSRNVFVKAIMIGNGEQCDLLRERIGRDNIDYISFIEGIPRKNLPDYYSSFDIFVFPTTLLESLGLVGLEAMACGVPVIGSDIGGIPTYLNHGENGFLFTAGSKKSLADAIMHYICLDKVEKAKFRSNALNTASEYDSSVIMKKLYVKLISIYQGCKHI